MYSAFKMFRFLGLIAIISTCQIFGKVRYKEVCFTSISTKADLYYRTEKDFSSNDDSLFMDFYEPEKDTASLRPVIVMLYGGSFLTGSRKDTLITTYSNYFASCGYAVFAIDYRIGFNPVSAAPHLELAKALYRAVQDSRAAVRFIRKNAESFKIDTSQIFAMGYSAGAITLIHHAYLEQTEASQNTMLEPVISSLGDLDQGDHLQYSSKLHCIINCCGAIADTSFIESGDIPILSFHGTADEIVPYDTGYAFNNPSTVALFGSFMIDQKAKSLGIPSTLVTFEGADHYLQGEPRITIPITTVNFLYGFMSGSNIRFKQPLKPTKMIPYATHNHYFDLSGRLIKNQSILSSALIVNRGYSKNGKTLMMIKSRTDRQ
jgi:acetyl esterase/lipase